jgi:hypothetical protein
MVVIQYLVLLLLRAAVEVEVAHPLQAFLQVRVVMEVAVAVQLIVQVMV